MNTFNSNGEETTVEGAVGGSSNGSNRGKKKSHQCHICGKVFQRSRDLEAHLRAHTGDKPFCCEKCGKGFKLKHHLKSHIYTVY